MSGIEDVLDQRDYPTPAVTPAAGSEPGGEERRAYVQQSEFGVTDEL